MMPLEKPEIKRRILTKYEKSVIVFSASCHSDPVLLSIIVLDGDLYTTIQKFGVSKMYSCFWKKSLRLTKAAFIW